MERSRRWTALIGGLLVVLAALAGCGGEAARSIGGEGGGPTRTPLASVTPGPAPGRGLSTLDGKVATLADWRGKGVILNFWATWCFPCREEMPALAHVHEANEGVVVVAVNYLEDAEQARAFVDELGLPFPILLDQQGWLASDLGVRGLPTTFFVDAEGRVVGSHVGPLDEAELAEAVERLRPQASGGG